MDDRRLVRGGLRDAAGRFRDRVARWKARRWGERPPCVHCGGTATHVHEPPGEAVCELCGVRARGAGPHHVRPVRPRDYFGPDESPPDLSAAVFRGTLGLAAAALVVLVVSTRPPDSFGDYVRVLAASAAAVVGLVGAWGALDG